MFDLQETRATFNALVKGSNLNQEFSFIGEFRVIDQAELQKISAQFPDEVVRLGADAVWAPYIKAYFVGWVNLEGHEDTWIKNAGKPIACTPEGIAALTRRPGVARAIIYTFLDACRESQVQQDGLGNLPPSPTTGTTEPSASDSEA